MGGDQPLDVMEAFGVEQHLTTAAVEKDGNGHPPGALAGDAPIAAFPHHRLDPVAAAGGQPVDGCDGLQGQLAKPLHRGKPLLRRAEDGGLFGAPVVGVAVGVGLLRQQGAGIPQGLDDRRVGILEHVEPGEGAGLIGEGARLIHRAKHTQAMLAAGEEVVHPMARGGVHQSRARLGGDVIAAHHHGAGAIQQGVAVEQARQFSPLHRHQGLQRMPQCLAETLHQGRGHHQIAGRLRSTVAAHGIVERSIHRHGQVGRQGPGGGGPDGHKQLLPVIAVGGALDARQPQGSLQAGGHLHHGKGDVDARGDVAFRVFQLRLRQGRAGAGTPVHGFEAAIDVAGQGHAAKHRDLGRLIGPVEGQVGPLPIPPDAPALETPPLDLHLLEGIGAGATAQRKGGEGLAFLGAEGLQHLQLDGQAMAIPPRPEAGPPALEQGVLVDDVLEDLV